MSSPLPGGLRRQPHRPGPGHPRPLGRDGEAFPTASGVNPMGTIEALAHMNGIAPKLS